MIGLYFSASRTYLDSSAGYSLTQFRRAFSREVIHRPKQGFSLVPSRGGYFFSWSKIFSFPFNKPAFSYNTVCNSFFEEKSNIFMLGYRLAEKNWRGSTVKERGELPTKSHIHYLRSCRGWKTGGDGRVMSGRGELFNYQSKESLLLVKSIVVMNFWKFTRPQPLDFLYPLSKFCWKWRPALRAV